MGDFYGTGIEIWARFGPIGSSEKKGLGRLWVTFEGGFFMFSGANFFKFFLEFFAPQHEETTLKSCS